MKFVNKHFWWIVAAIVVLVVAVYWSDIKTIIPKYNLGGGDPNAKKPETKGGAKLNMKLLLQKGSKGPEVSALQTRLKSAGADPGPIDGIFGQKTLDALRQVKGIVIVSTTLETYDSTPNMAGFEYHGTGLFDGLPLTYGAPSKNTGFVPPNLVNEINV